MFSLAIYCFDLIMFTLIHEPKMLCVLFFRLLDFTSFTSHIHNWDFLCFGSISSFFLELFLHSSPVAYWAPTGLVSSALSITSFHTVHGILKARLLDALRMLKYNKTHNTFLNKYTLLKTELFNESKVNNAFLSIPDHFPF